MHIRDEDRDEEEEAANALLLSEDEYEDEEAEDEPTCRNCGTACGFRSPYACEANAAERFYSDGDLFGDDGTC